MAVLTRGPAAAPGFAVVFDVDGVLVDSFDAHRWSWRALAAETGVSFGDDDFVASFGQTSRDVIARHWRAPVGSGRNRVLDDRKEALYRERLRAAFAPVDGALELVDALHAAAVRMAVGSSAPPENVELTLELLGRRAAFAAVVTGRDVARGKPHPDVYLACAERLGMPAAGCVVVEDAPVGVEAAHAAGMRCVALVGTTDAGALGAADRVVRSLRELDPGALAMLAAA